MPAKTPADIEAEIDQALRRCRSLSAEGLWRRMRFLMEYKSDRKPYARLNGSPILPEQLPEWAGCSAEAVTRGLPRLMGNGLIVESSEGYCSKPLQRIFEARAAVARRVGRHRALRNAQQGVTSVLRNADVTPRPPPPVSSPPITPSSSSPTPEDSVCCANGAAALPTASPASPARGRAKGAKKPERPPVPGFAEAQRFWLENWAAAHHGAEYAPGKGGWAREGKDLAEILEDLHAREDVTRALTGWRLLVARFLREPDVGFYQGHRLPRLRENLAHFKSEVKRELNGGSVNGNHKPTAAERGHYPEPAGGLPEFGAKRAV